MSTKEENENESLGKITKSKGRDRILNFRSINLVKVTRG